MGNFCFYFLQVENILSKKFQLIFFYVFLQEKTYGKNHRFPLEKKYSPKLTFPSHNLLGLPKKSDRF